MTYLGDHVRARLRLCGCDNFIMKLPNNRARRRCEVGSRMTAGWSVEDCFALDVDAGAKIDNAHAEAHEVRR